MKILTIFLIPAGVLIASPAPAQEPGPREQRGAALVTEHCAMCHAAGRTDLSLEPQAPALRDIGQRVPLDLLQSQLTVGLLGGHPRMPQFKLAPRDAESIIVYLRAIQTR